MNYARLAELASSNTKNTINLAKLFAVSFTAQREIDQGRIGLREKLLIERKQAYRSILESVEQKEEAEGSKLNSLFGALGLGGLARGLKGIKASRSVTATPALPRVLPTPPQVRRIGRGIIPRTPKLPRGRLAGIPGLNVALTGLDFLQRKQAGQTNLQAGAGSLASTLAAIGTAGLVGTAVGGPVGTVVGLAAGALAAFGTGSLVDMITGANRPVGVEQRLREEERRTRIIGKTKFSEALDRFDNVLGNLSKLSQYLKTKPSGGPDTNIPNNTQGVKPEDLKNPITPTTDPGPPSPEGRMPNASAPGAYGIPGDPKSPRIGEWVGSLPSRVRSTSRGVGGPIETKPQRKTVSYKSPTKTRKIADISFEVSQIAGKTSIEKMISNSATDNILVMDKQPDTLVVQQPSSSSGGSFGSVGPSSYEVAAKYAQMISSLTR